MDCPECGTRALAFSVPEHLAGHLPDGRPAAALCPRCLRVTPAESGTDAPDFTAVSDSFPRDREAATTLAVALALLDSPALYRDELEALVGRLERTGVDPLLVLCRLADDDDLDPHLELDRRRHQLEELLS